MIRNLKNFALAGMLLLSSMVLLPGCSDPGPNDSGTNVPAPTQSTQRDELLQLNRELSTQYQLFQSAVNTARYSATINGRTFSAAAKVERDQDFKDHTQAARDAYNSAFAAYNARDARTCAASLRQFRSEISQMNSIGWYNTLHKLRTSSDEAVQQVSFDNGYRDNKSWKQWHNHFNPRNTDSLWNPNLSSTGGGANFGPGPDFNEAW